MSHPRVIVDTTNIEIPLEVYDPSWEVVYPRSEVEKEIRVPYKPFSSLTLPVQTAIVQQLASLRKLKTLGIIVPNPPEITNPFDYFTCFCISSVGSMSQ